MTLLSDLRRATFNLLPKARTKNLHVGVPSQRCLPQPIFSRSSFHCSVKYSSSFSCIFKNNSNYNLRDAGKLSCVISSSTRSIGTSENIRVSFGKALMKSSELQFSNEAKSLIASCKSGFRQSKPNIHCTIVEPSPATTAVSALLADLTDDDIIVEINPGPGCLTRQLLERTKNKLIIFESREFFYDRLASAFRSQIDEGRLVISAHNFHNFYPYYLHPKEDHYNDPALSPLGIVPGEAQPDRLKIKVIGGIKAGRFFSRLQLCTMLGVSFFERCDPIFYFYTTDEIVNKFFTSFPLKSFKKSSKHALLSNFIFKLDQVGTETCSGFYPLPKPKTEAGAHKGDCSSLRLVRLEPKRAFLNTMTRAERELFMFFIQHLSQRSSRNLLIDSLEMWLPGIGISLIDAGFNVFTFSAQLTVDEVLLAYHIFRTHPNFSVSNFTNAVHSFINMLTNSHSVLSCP